MGSLDDQKLARHDAKKHGRATTCDNPRRASKAQRRDEAAMQPSEPLSEVAKRMKEQGQQDAYRHFVELLERISDTAWLRIIPKHDEGETHWYIKYNRGKHAGYYLYYMQRDCDTVYDAIDFLTTRWIEVATGQRKPIRDRVYCND